jgi:hypothetical protein
MAIDPNIALNFRGVELANPLAQYGQLSAIQAAQNQNALAQYQLSAAQRADEQQNKLYSAAQQPNFKLDFQSAIQYGAPGIAAFKAQQEAANAALTQTKTQAEIEEKQLKNRNDKLNFAYNLVGSAPTPEAAAQKIKEGLRDGYLDFNTASAELKQIQDLRTPEDFQQYRLKKLMGILKEKDKVEFMLPKIKQQEAGGNILGIQDNPTMPGYGLPIPGMAIKKTATIGEQTGQARLAFEQSKFAWEKANPGYELKEDTDGNMFGINKRTLQAFPVTVGGGAPAAAPAVSGAGMPGPRVNQPSVVQAIPGMNSVLDQTVPAAAPATAPAAGGSRQLVGKTKEAPAKFHDIDLQLAGLAGSLKSFKDEIKNEPITGAPLLPKGADTARMQAKYISLLMGLKDLYTLGALTGPDMSIIESQINNPASWSGKLATYNGIKEQTKVIEDMLQRSTQNVENTYGRKPNATIKAMEPLKNLPGASDSDPLGILKGKR